MKGEGLFFGTVVERREVAHSRNYSVFHLVFVVSQKVLKLLELIMLCVSYTLNLAESKEFGIKMNDRLLFSLMEIRDTAESFEIRVYYYRRCGLDSQVLRNC